jgi:EAL domain-containing protein (putative c-di-GMP-specific phosphodiesterase class I)
MWKVSKGDQVMWVVGDAPAAGILKTMDSIRKKVMLANQQLDAEWIAAAEAALAGNKSTLAVLSMGWNGDVSHTHCHMSNGAAHRALLQQLIQADTGRVRVSAAGRRESRMDMLSIVPRSVLVIDDEPAIGEAIAMVARKLGMSCTVMTSGLQLADEVDPAITAIIIDLMMPGMDGIELVRQLAASRCRATIVLMSGHDRGVLRSVQEMANTLGLRTGEPLQKPFRLADIEAVLNAVAEPQLDRRRVVGRARQALPEDELRAAISERAVVVHYQPQVSLATRRVEGVEALARLRIPRLGLVYPDQFIEETEQLGLMDALTDIMLESSLAEVGTLEGLAEATLSINFPASSLVDLALPDRIAQRAAQAGIPLSRLVVEITESGLIQEFGKALDVLARLRLRGAGVSIDDFGTGYSSMAQLRRVPCTELKIDRMFVKDMLIDDSAKAVVEESIELAHRLKLRVVAEGVETQQQARALADAGCDLAQGYYYARPIPARDLAVWLAARAADLYTAGGARLA